MQMEFKLPDNIYMGFFSMTLIMVYNYMVCKRDGLPFYLNSAEWVFAHDKGWNDYFTTFAEKPEGPVEAFYKHPPGDKEFTVREYKDAMREVFVFQPHLLEAADQTMKRLGMDGPFTAIFIRRGDKLLGESVYIPAELYVRRALETNPSAVFVQTDDYRCVLEVTQMIQAVNPAIRVFSTCPSWKLGHFAKPVEECAVVSTSHRLPDGRTIVNNLNAQYLQLTPRQKPFAEYTKPEIKEHAEEFLIGMILCQRGEHVVIDNTSNVGRYLGFTHPSVKYVEDLRYCITEGVPLLPAIPYKDDQLITCPTGHAYHSNYT